MTEKKGKHKKSLIKRLFGIKFLIFLSFFLIVFLLVTFSTGGLGGVSITGMAIGTGTIEDNEGITFEAEIEETNTPIRLNQELEKMTIKVNEATSNLYIGKDGILDLSTEEEVEIILEGFKGRTSFDTQTLLTLEGEANKILINGIPTIARTETIRVLIEEPMNYQTIIAEQARMNTYEAQTTGELILGGSSVAIELEKETMNIKGFKGQIQSGKISRYGIGTINLIMKGTVKEFDTQEGIGINIGNKE
jgi:hypothetical protein